MAGSIGYDGPLTSRRVGVPFLAPPRTVWETADGFEAAFHMTTRIDRFGETRAG